MTNTLNALHTQAWQHLNDAVLQPTHALHYLALSSIDPQGKPQARLLVLRAADTQTASLEFHTDIRSTKWTELQTNPQLSLLGYDPEHRIQLRFNGTATLFGPETAYTQQAWQQLSVWTRHSYCGGPPGYELSAPETAEMTAPPDAATTAVGKQVFGVIQFKADTLDWFHHPRGALRRALFRYGPAGSVQSANWIRP